MPLLSHRPRRNGTEGSTGFRELYEVRRERVPVGTSTYSRFYSAVVRIDLKAFIYFFSEVSDKTSKRAVTRVLQYPNTAITVIAVYFRTIIRA